MASRLNSFLAFAIYSLLVNALYARNSVGNVGHYIAIEKIEAEEYTFIANALVHDDCPDSNNLYFIGDVDSETVIQYDGVDFGGESFVSGDTISLRLTNSYPDTGAPINVSVHLGSSTNPPIATLPVPYTGDSCDFVSVNFTFNQLLTGVQDLVFTFPNPPEGGFFQLDWFQFSRGIFFNYNASEKIESEDYTSIYDAETLTGCSESAVTYVAPLESVSVITYDKVKFDSEDSITLHAASIFFVGYITVSLHLGSSSNPPFVDIPVYYSGGPCTFITVDFDFGQSLTGVQDLVFTFPNAPAGGYIHLDWFQFNQTATSHTIPAIAQI